MPMMKTVLNHDSQGFGFTNVLQKGLPCSVLALTTGITLFLNLLL